MKAWAAALLLMVGCAFRPTVRPPGDPEVGVLVRWWGHSCFSFHDSVGRVVLIDPFDDTVGFASPRLSPDVVVVTHEHFDHDAVGRPPGGMEPAADGASVPARGPAQRLPYAVVRSTGLTSAGGVEFNGMLADHDNEKGARHGTTRIYVWEMGGVRFAHLGDVGQTSWTTEQKSFLSDIDVMFVPVGGQTTVNGSQAAALVRSVSPRIVVPMHYGTARTRFFEFDSAAPFVSLFERVDRLAAPEFRVRRADRPPDTTVFIPALPSEEGTAP